MIFAATNGYLDGLAVGRCGRYEDRLLAERQGAGASAMPSLRPASSTTKTS